MVWHSAPTSKELYQRFCLAAQLAIVAPPIFTAQAVSDMVKLVFIEHDAPHDEVDAAVAGSAIQVGGQDNHANEKGAHTGDTSAAQLKDAGCTYAIVGHSERRTDHAESDEMVNAKAAAAQANGLIAVICIGETEAQRDAGQTLEVNGTQIAGSVPDGSTAANTVIAYEPVWAIGTGRTPTSAEVQDVHAYIRGELAKKIGQDEADKTRILYGGSMNPGNAKELLALADVDGGLIGGASLKVDDFWAVATSA